MPAQRLTPLKAATPSCATMRQRLRKCGENGATTLDNGALLHKCCIIAQERNLAFLASGMEKAKIATDCNSGRACLRHFYGVNAILPKCSRTPVFTP
jgi:hypothetical protein